MTYAAKTILWTVSEKSFEWHTETTAKRRCTEYCSPPGIGTCLYTTAAFRKSTLTSQEMSYWKPIRQIVYIQMQQIMAETNRTQLILQQSKWQALQNRQTMCVTLGWWVTVTTAATTVVHTELDNTVTSHCKKQPVQHWYTLITAISL